MAVRLRCTGCGQSGLSALIHHGPGQHVCKHCGGLLVLADAHDERRSGRDRRSLFEVPRSPDWRSGHDRRGSAPAG